MKKKLIIVSGIIALSMIIMLSFSSFKPSPVDNEGYATMIVYENFAIVNSKIIITYPNEETEIIELGPFKYNDNYLTDNNKVVTKTLNKLKNEGYEVVTMTASGKINSNKAMRITTILLEND